MNPETLAIYAQDLSSYEISVIAEALDGMGTAKRAEGEMAFPEIGAIFGVIRGLIRARGDRKAIDEINAMVAHKAAHPELYETSEEEREMAKKINERFGFERPKVIDTTPVMQACPHCSQELPIAPNLRFWTVLELRDYADVLERNQAIAAANRAASMAAQMAPAEVEGGM